MIDFDEVLDICLRDLAGGATTLDECLLRHPAHAAQLEPLLTAAIALQRGQGIRPSAAFKARARAGLTLHMRDHPRSRPRMNFAFWKFATSLAVILLALLVTGAAYAQGTLPGDAFYSWKLTSERLWRAVSPDAIGTDISIANRRIEEMNAVANDPLRFALALDGYYEVLARLESELDAETLENILPENIPSNDGIPLITPTLPVEPTSTVEAGGTIEPQVTAPVSLPTPEPEIIPTIDLPPLPPLVP